ncbi:hypothetical protein [Simplicispira suum]|uniref:hypothetical protein n=1 Tax=Simplicispira suum TaxID=2109915 RepID=UPI00147674B1|nr:hypothetical protein [Simplicispira suum]
MKIVVKVTRAELAEMDSSEEQLEDAVRNAVTGGIDDGNGTLYLNDVHVDVQVTG